jgi:hypothetical protein
MASIGCTIRTDCFSAPHDSNMSASGEWLILRVAGRMNGATLAELQIYKGGVSS